MQPVTSFLSINTHYGAIGVSALYTPLLGGEAVRKTLLYIRDGRGEFVRAVIADAEVF